MIKTTIWSPDTCGCVLEYEWDNALKEDIRTHTFKKAVKVCEHHKALLGSEAYGQAVSENTRKNIIWGEVQKIKPALPVEDYTWSFDANRKLKVGFLGQLEVAEKSTLQTLCDTKFGVGKVKVI